MEFRIYRRSVSLCMVKLSKYHFGITHLFCIEKCYDTHFTKEHVTVYYGRGNTNIPVGSSEDQIKNNQCHSTCWPSKRDVSSIWLVATSSQIVPIRPVHPHLPPPTTNHHPMWGIVFSNLWKLKQPASFGKKIMVTSSCTFLFVIYYTKAMGISFLRGSWYIKVVGTHWLFIIWKTIIAKSVDRRSHVHCLTAQWNRWMYEAAHALSSPSHASEKSTTVPLILQKLPYASHPVLINIWKTLLFNTRQFKILLWKANTFYRVK